MALKDWKIIYLQTAKKLYKLQKEQDRLRARLKILHDKIIETEGIRSWNSFVVNKVNPMWTYDFGDY